MAPVFAIPTDWMMASAHDQCTAYTLRWVAGEIDDPETALIRLHVAQAADSGLLEGDARTGYRLGHIGRSWLAHKGL